MADAVNPTPTNSEARVMLRAHQEALLRRRIKFVVEKGSMARLFKAGMHGALQEELFHCLTPETVVSAQTQEDYDRWLLGVVQSGRWEPYSRNGLGEDRWGYFAKLINIITYEVRCNRELCSDADWQRLNPFLHIPLDSNVFLSLSKLDPSFPACWVLKGMSEREYIAMQCAARNIAEPLGVPTIWLEDAWVT